MKNLRGFTLLEILLVVAAIAILAGIVIVAINPGKQLAATRDAQRHSDVNAISSAIAQYILKSGSYPDINYGVESCDGANWDSTTYGICVTGVDCGGIRLDTRLVPDYVPSLPVDPSKTGDTDGFSGYSVTKFSGRVLVCAQLTEEADTMISVTR